MTDMTTNRNGDQIEETLMFWYESKQSDEDRNMAIFLILEHLKMKMVRTNATKSGNVEIELRKDE